MTIYSPYLPGSTEATVEADAKKAIRRMEIADPRNKAYTPYGNCLKIFYSHDQEVMFAGPSGTGKSRSILEKMHLLCCKYPGMRALMVRKTREALTQSAMVTFEKFVVPDNGTVKFRTAEQEYRYSNGSVVALGGMDKSSKIMSSEYDFIYPMESTELTEEDWEALVTRARFGVMPYNQVMGDCNPGPPRHWIRKRMDRGALLEIKSEHTDNPTLYNHSTKHWTERGENYLRKLDSLTGVRYLRLRKGLWAAAEGMIYDEYDPTKHQCNRFPVPKSWLRIWVIDFGYTNPIVWQCWAIDPETEIAYMIAEIYQTKLLVEDLADKIKIWAREENEPYPQDVICDWDAEDRATLERHLEIQTTPANKDVLNGIQNVKSGLKIDPATGLPRIIWMRDSLLEKDPALEDVLKPTCTIEEIEPYEWEDNKKKEQPKKIDDHGMDCTRYLRQHIVESTLSWSRGRG